MPARAVRAPTVNSPSRHSRSKIARRLGSARDLNNWSGVEGFIIHNSLAMGLFITIELCMSQEERLDRQVRQPVRTEGDRDSGAAQYLADQPDGLVDHRGGDIEMRTGADAAVHH